MNVSQKPKAPSKTIKTVRRRHQPTSANRHVPHFSMNGHQNFVDIDVGRPPFAYEESPTFRFRFHNFANLPTTKDVPESSPQFTCFGRPWAVGIYPGGTVDARDGMISISVGWDCDSDEESSVCVGIEATILDLDGKQCRRSVVKSIVLSNGARTSQPNFVSRAGVMDPANNLLDVGTLTVQLKLTLNETNAPCQPFAPENPFAQNMRKLFLDETSADVLFAVQNPDDEESTNFHAHRVVLKLCASNLDVLCGSYTNLTPIPISRVEPKVFKLLLLYVYGGTISTKDWKHHSQKLIDAADLYGVVNLKLKAELMYAKYMNLTVENVTDALVYADSKQCAYLKETVMDFIVKNESEVLQKVATSKHVPESSTMFTDLLAAMARGKGNSSAASAESLDMNMMRVGALRKKLHERGLDVDGSRETLVARLKENSMQVGEKRKRTD